VSEQRDSRIAGAIVFTEAIPYAARIDADGHALRADEPVVHGGQDSGPAPFGLVMSGLGACTAITLRMYAEHKGWPLEGIQVRLDYHAAGRETRWIDRVVTLAGALDDSQRAKLAEIAERTPVTKAIKTGTEIRTTFNPAGDRDRPMPKGNRDGG
jgi:putative redox protein